MYMTVVVGFKQLLTLYANLYVHVTEERDHVHELIVASCRDSGQVLGLLDRQKPAT